MRGSGRWILVAAVAVIAGLAVWLSGAFEPDDVRPPDSRALIEDPPPASTDEHGAEPSGGPVGIGTLPFRPEPEPGPAPEATTADGDPSGLTLTGVVLHEDRPVAGAQIELHEDDGWMESASSIGRLRESKTTGPPGTFAFGRLYPAERLFVEVRHPEYAMARVRIDTARAADLRQVIRLERGLTLEGRVTHVDGRPLEGVQVAVFDLGVQAHDPADQLERRVETAPDGMYVLGGVRAGIKRCEVSRRDLATGFRPVLNVTTDQKGLDFVLRDGAAIAGTVVEELSRAGVAGARVVARLVTPDGSIDSARDTLKEALDRKMNLHAAEAGADGRFEIPGLLPGEYELWATADGHLMAQRTRARTGTINVDVPVRLGARLEGRVVDDRTGEPVSPAIVILTGNPEFTLLVRGRYARVQDPEGAFVLSGLPAGSHYLVARAEGFAETSTEAPIVVRAGEVRKDLEIRLQGGAVLTGIVAGDAGEPLPGVRIELARKVVNATNDPAAGFLAPIFQTGAARVHGRTDGEGHYRIDNLRAGTWTLSFTHDERAAFHTTEIVVTAGAHLDLGTTTLTAGGSIDGVVTASSGKPDGLARVALSGITDPSFRQEVATGPDGRFRFSGLPRGDYRVTLVQREGKPDLSGLLAGLTQAANVVSVNPGMTVAVKLP